MVGPEQFIRIVLLLVLMSEFSTGVFANEEKLKFQIDYKLTGSSPTVVESGIPQTFNKSDLISGLSLPKDSKLWFGSFIFGDPNSKAVVVLKVDHRNTSTLYVDTNRNQSLADEKPITNSPQANQWMAELEPVTDKSSAIAAQRIHVLFSWNAEENTLSKTTAGVMTGSTRFAGEDRLVKLVDFNHNGCWLESDDRIMLDVNGNKKISRIAEQFPCAGMLKIQNALYTVRGNSSGTAVSLQPVRAKGQVVAKIKLSDELGLVENIKAVLRSDSGIQLVVDDLGKPFVCPIGNYHVSELVIEVANRHQHYWFFFSRNGPGTHACQVKDNEQTSIELLGNLTLNAQISRIANKDEDVISVIPSLLSENGLFLINSKFGKTAAISENRLRMRASSASSWNRSGSSGFS